MHPALALSNRKANTAARPSRRSSDSHKVNCGSYQMQLRLQELIDLPDIGLQLEGAVGNLVEMFYAEDPALFHLPRGGSAAPDELGDLHVPRVEQKLAKQIGRRSVAQLIRKDDQRGKIAPAAMCKKGQ